MPESLPACLALAASGVADEDDGVEGGRAVFAIEVGDILSRMRLHNTTTRCARLNRSEQSCIRLRVCVAADNLL